MKDNNKFDAIRLIRGGNNCEDSLSADSLNNEYKNIDLRKILGDNMEPDEKVIYVAKSHWSMLALVLLFLLFDIMGFASQGVKFIMTLGGGIIFSFSILSYVLFLNLYVILTNKRLVIPISARKKGILLKAIINTTSFTNILGAGRLFIEHRKAPKRILPIISHIRNVKKLEQMINEQVELIQSRQEQEVEWVQKQDSTEGNKFEIPIVIIGFFLIQSFLIYKGLAILSKILTMIFIGYLVFNKFFKNRY